MSVCGPTNICKCNLRLPRLIHIFQTCSNSGLTDNTFNKYLNEIIIPKNTQHKKYTVVQY